MFKNSERKENSTAKNIILFPNPESLVTVSDGLISSLNTFGKVNIHHISAITGKSYLETIEELDGVIFQNPLKWNEIYHEGWELSEEYLSGDIYEKIKIAEQANEKYPGIFKKNIDALKNVPVKPIEAEDIYVTLGSPWIPSCVIDDFITYLFGEVPKQYRYFYRKEKLAVEHDKKTGKWTIPCKDRYKNSPEAIKTYSTYGTDRINAFKIIEKTLNFQAIEIQKEASKGSSGSGSKDTIDKDATLLAIEKQNLIIQKFRAWIWKDEKRKKELVEIYNRNYCYINKRVYDGSFLWLPGLSDEINLYPHQKNAVARILFTPNTLLAHEVGSGKTLLMIAAGMELLRTGITKKNLYVVPNNVMVQWISDFTNAYPSADIFCINHTNFGGKKSHSTLETVKNGSFDAVIIASSSFDKIYPSANYYEKEKNQSASDDMIFFDELGIDGLFVDEAHNYKNLDHGIKDIKVLGISGNGAKKSCRMLEKVRHVQSKPNGRVVFATGTPITNSLTDLFSMQTYLQSEELKHRGLDKFRSWINLFAEEEPNIEIDVDTTKHRLAVRFSRFHNIPELINIFSLVADCYHLNANKNLPLFNGYTDVKIPPTEEFKEFLRVISKRIDMVRTGLIPKTEDNMLKIVGDARRGALDIRLVNSDAEFSLVSKVYRCATETFAVYQKTMQQKSAQLIFCDTSVPKTSFNIYDELKRLLVYMGVPETEIAFVHDAQTDNERKALFEKVKKGKIRILIGSTQKLGVGVNVQDRLVALHHIDIPWRPADVVQREGRIIRQGNTNSEIQIFRYITESSFDAYSWQLLEVKQRFINRIMSGMDVERSAADIDDILDYAEAKAIATGNPLIKKRVETAIELERVMALQRGINMHCMSLKKQLDEIPELISKYKKTYEEKIADGNHYNENKHAYSKSEKEKIEAAVFETVKKSVMSSEERTLLEYQGFEITVPANMLKEKPYIILKKEGRHYVDLGKTQKGIITRIDNHLNGLIKKALLVKDTIDALKRKENTIKNELSNQENHCDEIESLKRKLKKIDEELEKRAAA